MINIQFINATSVQLVTVGSPKTINYTLGSGSSPVFTCSDNFFSKNDKNYYKFEITGSNVQLSGTIDSVSEPYQFFNLFQGQSAITDASQLTLAATSVKEWAYANMFLDCKNLTTPPTISATTLAEWCYQGMFGNCFSLSSFPALPATNLAKYCYYAMFYNCKSLSSAPYLSATTLQDWCYNSMFYNCRNLTSISSNFSSWGTNATTNWVTGIRTSGEFYNDTVPVAYGVDRIPESWKNYSKMPLTFKSASTSSKIALVQSGSPNSVTLQCSKNGGEWTAYSVGDEIDLNQNETIAFRGNNDHFSKDPNNFYRFAMTGTVEGDGNIQSLMNFSNVAPSACYNKMFSGCVSLTKAPQLPATSIAKNSYLNMFRGCSNLVTAPASLPATTLTNVASCYYAMFKDCTALTSSPQLPATDLSQSSGCYRYMFQGCSNLVSAGAISAQTLTNTDYGMQGMFQSCNKLVKMPKLNAWWGAGVYCAGDMFRGCTSLTGAEELKFNELVYSNCCQAMFSGCTSLVTLPSALATPHYSYGYQCYRYMFKGCTALTNIPSGTLNFAYLSDYACSGMFQGCTSLKTIHSINISGNASRNGDIGPSSCYEMFQGCTALTASPQITISHGFNGSHSCYNMFKDCTGMVSAGPIHVSSVGQYSLYQMFGWCTSLVTPPAMTELSAVNTYSMFQMFRGCTSLTSAIEFSDDFTTGNGNWAFASMYRQCSSLVYVPPMNLQTISGQNIMRGMFNDCTSLTAIDVPVTGCSSLCGMYGMLCGCTALTSISAHFTEWPTETITNGWVRNVAPTGVFTKPSILTETYNDNRIPTNWQIEYDYSTMPLTFKGKAETNAVQLSAVGLPSAISLNYKKNNGDWTTYTVGDVIELSANQIVAFSGNNNQFNKWQASYHQFIMTGTIEADGNIQSLMNFSDSVNENAYYSLFRGCTNLVTPPKLLATTLANACYGMMFAECTSLTITPQLPATTLAPYSYSQMFYNCYNLKTVANNQLPATGLASRCYMDMFWGCSSLTSAPALPATELADWCYKGMFRGCTSLMAAPQLPATTLADNCYRMMFEWCTKLSSINVSFTDWDDYTDSTVNWLGSVAANGEFICQTALGTNETITRGTSNCPENWTVVNK